MLAAAAIRAGDASVVVAGGMESMNQGPYLLPEGALRLPPGQCRAGRLDRRRRPVVRDRGLPHGHARRARRDQSRVSRADQDAFALESHRRAVAAIDAAGSPTRSCRCPSAAAARRCSLTTDESPRRDTTAEALARLKPVFDLPDRRGRPGRRPGHGHGGQRAGHHGRRRGNRRRQRAEVERSG